VSRKNRRLSVRTKNVVVEPYNPKWKEEFERLKSYFESHIGSMIIGIEHVGSTSVEGLSAKPIIDLDMVIENYDRFDEVKNILEGLGYYHEGDLGIKGREAFEYEGKEDFLTHHLYVCPKDSQALRNHLVFRDHLRKNKYDRDMYGQVKSKAALDHPRDIDGYMEAKSHLILEIYEKLGLELQ
jgi:GrpB-like predicted nucleotidyltransferase (UPF0157 family)